MSMRLQFQISQPTTRLTTWDTFLARTSCFKIMETGATVAVCNSVDDPKPDDQTMDFAKLILRIEINYFFTKNLRTMQAETNIPYKEMCAQL